MHLPRADQPKRRTFTAEYKLKVLADYDAAEPGEKGALLQRLGPECPQNVRTGPPGGRMQAIRNGVQIVTEEARVHVQSHRRRGVPHHLLDHLHFGPCRDRQAGRRMPEVVR